MDLEAQLAQLNHCDEVLVITQKYLIRAIKDLIRAIKDLIRVIKHLITSQNISIFMDRSTLENLIEKEKLTKWIIFYVV